MRDILNVESSERVDLSDFLFGIDDSPQAAHEELLSEFATGGAYKVLSGFAMSNPVGKQVQVDRGTAIIGRREGPDVRSSVLTTTGDVNKIVDLTAFSAGTYGIYIRFDLLDAENEVRSFWDPSAGGGAGDEFSQTIPTRRLANWSLRVESSSPGGEYLKIGEVDQATMAITDQRDFYFEGEINNFYQSGWSTDGGGAALDRDANRSLNGVTDLQMFTAAMRECLVDIKGRGLRQWFERDIGGMNIGFDANPVSGRLAVGDADFYLEASGGSTKLSFDSPGNNTFLEYNRSLFRWRWLINPGVIHHEMDNDGFNAGLQGSAFDQFRFRAETNLTTGGRPIMEVKHETSAAMVDTFGPTLDFLVTDSSITDERTGRIATARNGADTSHDMEFYVDNGGALVGPVVRIGADLETYLAFGGLQVTGGDIVGGNIDASDIDLARNDALTTPMLSLVQSGTGDASIFFEAGGSPGQFCVGTDNTTDYLGFSPGTALAPPTGGGQFGGGQAAGLGMAMDFQGFLRIRTTGQTLSIYGDPAGDFSVPIVSIAGSDAVATRVMDGAPLQIVPSSNNGASLNTTGALPTQCDPGDFYVAYAIDSPYTASLYFCKTTNNWTLVV